MSNFFIIKKYSFLFLMLSIFIPSEILGMHHERELDKMKINNLYDDWYIAVETSDIPVSYTHLTLPTKRIV